MDGAQGETVLAAAGRPGTLGFAAAPAGHATIFSMIGRASTARRRRRDDIFRGAAIIFTAATK